MLKNTDILTKGTIQVLCQHVFHLFRPTHLISRHQHFLISILNMTSAFSHIQPPTHLWIRPRLERNANKKVWKTISKKDIFFSVHAKKFFPWIFFSYFLLTSAIGHPYPPTLSANVRNRLRLATIVVLVLVDKKTRGDASHQLELIL